MSRRLTSLLLCSSLGLACTPTQKEGEAAVAEAEARTEEAAPEAQPAPVGMLPANTYALVTIPEPEKRLAELKSFAKAVSSEPAFALGRLEAMMQNFDLRAPIHVLLLDPQVHEVPAVVVGKVANADALGSSLPEGMEVRSSGGLTILGAVDTADQVDPWLADVLPTRAVPSVITADFDPTFLRQKYAMFKPILAMGMQQSPGADAVGPIFETVEAFGSEVGGLQVRFEIGSERVDMVAVVEGRADTTLRTLARAQAGAVVPSDLVRRVARSDATLRGGAAMVKASREVMGEWTSTMMGSMVTLPADEFRTFIDLWTEISGDEFAVSTTMTSPTDASSDYVFSVADQAKATAYLKGEWAKFFEKSYETMGNSKFTGHGCKVDAGSLHGEVDVLSCSGVTVFEPKPQGLGLPDQQSQFGAAIVDGFMLLTLGDPARLGDLEQRLEREPDAVAPWLDEAIRRGEWMSFRFDFDNLPTEAGNMGVPGASIEFGVGSEGDALTFRVGLDSTSMQALKKVGAAAAG